MDSLESLLKQTEERITEVKRCHEDLMAAIPYTSAAVVIPLGLILAKSAKLKFNAQERF